MTFAASRQSSALWIWPVGLVATMSFLLASYVTKEYELRFGKPYPNNHLSRLKRRDLRILVIAVGALLAQPFPALLTIGALTHLVVLCIMIDVWRKAEQSAVLGSPGNLSIPDEDDARWEEPELVTAATRSSKQTAISRNHDGAHFKP